MTTNAQFKSMFQGLTSAKGQRGILSRGKNVYENGTQAARTGKQTSSMHNAIARRLKRTN